MSFTFSHPALVLPFTKIKKLSATGLIIGSMISDAEYYIRMNDKRIYTHTIAGLFWCDIPLSIIIAFLFHNVVRNYLFCNLPAYFKKRFIVFNNFNWNSYFKKNWLVVILCIILGGFTHLLLDNFCHENGYFDMKIPFLTSHNFFNGYDIEGWMFLQAGTSIIGLVVIVIIIARLPVYNIANSKTDKGYWLIIAFITFTILSVRLLFFSNLKNEIYIITFLSGLMIAFVLTPLILKAGNLFSRKN